MNFDGLIGKRIVKVTGDETEVKNKVELKSWFEDGKLYVGEYVKHKINQIDEPEVTLDKAFEKVAESYSMTKEEVWRRIEWFETHTEVLTQEWIDEYAQGDYDEWVYTEDLQTLLVPKQELPVIPKFVAEWYEREGKRSSWWNWFYKWGRGGNQSDLETKTIGWMQDYNEEKFVDMFRCGYEVEEEPLYHAKIKGWEILGGGVKWVYLENSKGLIIGDVTFPDDETEAMTKEEWNELGINDTNADFEEVS